LARREYGRRELEAKLVERGCDEHLATETVASLAGEGLVSDDRFIESLIHVRRERGYGPRYIRRELEEKGIGRDVISRWLDPSGREWLDDLRLVHKKKFGGRKPASLKERARQTRFLESRGFTHDQIRSILGSDED
jgi:regulatory protein